MRVLIVGCGLSGATCAALLKRHNSSIDVVMVDRREHIAGNCYDSYLGGNLVHNYGPHAFHTDKQVVWDFVTSFVPFNDFKHQVTAELNDLRQINIPFNNLTSTIVGDWDQERIISELFTAYSEKHWGMPWDDLPDCIKRRVPKKRKDALPYYHLDPYQGLPCGGYHELIKAMIDECEYHLTVESWRGFVYRGNFDLVIYTGSIDEYYGNIYGQLPYRSLQFEFTYGARQRTVQTNFCHQHTKATRLIDHGYWTGSQGHRTVLSTETPCQFDSNDQSTDRYYPMQWGNGLSVYREYHKLTKDEPKTLFLGRLGTYKYLDMDDCIMQAMTVLRKNNVIA